MDTVMTSRLSVEQVKDEETMARAGDSGPLHDPQEADPWSTGEIENLETRWLQKEITDHAAKEQMRSSFRKSSHKDESCKSSTYQSRSSQSSHDNSTNDHVIDIGQDALKEEPDKVQEIELALSPLSDTPLISEFALFGPSNPQELKKGRLNNLLEYFTILVHLAFFGIIGVLIRYGLEVIFDHVLSVTHEGTILYRDLPANVVGSFFMGWVGIIWKKDILLLSEPMAIGLSTGLMGSITTYAAWNQKMVALLTVGNVGAALSGLLLGMAIVQMFLLAGIDSARGLKYATAKFQGNQNIHGSKNVRKQLHINLHGGMVSSTVITFATACLWGAALVLLIHGNNSQKLDILWLACLVAPPGVWVRWHLARFNGRGLGGRLKWLPVGTLMANLLGASLEAVLSLLECMVTSDNAAWVIGGLQLGFLGCLSTVSTFVAEVYTMHVGPMQLKAYTYTMLTLGSGLVLSGLLYSAPALAKGYVKW